ncbi:MAG: type VI secretion system baseplate subunit TssE [Deltaproteobacteria bacterium]|uniref:type VI secretion system baseplate subunit TssE n=1 Tax=Desulfobacula sp. TaxID=2593537 RepID=UPI0019CA61E1|nr:type VI secretion system baseplate subunit TssE [Candidatus Desulfobacula maris]MBL6993049.1 type VI secretion system baseplate subunit TssE [Desulfobacula sp.]
MYELTLLERIDALESTGEEEIQENPVEIEMRSIMTHLKKLLNTNMGSVQIADDYGMPDMTVFAGGGLSETIKNIEKAVLTAVKKYEKRLSKIKVKIESDKKDVLTIHFSLEGVLARQKNVPIFFETSVRPGGKISINRQGNRIV